MPSSSRMQILARLRGVLSHCVARNALALYAVQFAGYALPVVTLSFLARVLEPAVWGLVAFAQSFAWWVALLLEYGFNYSATREVARNQSDPNRIRQIVADVTGAKLLLCAVAALAGLAIGPLIPAFREHPNYLAWALVSAFFAAFGPLWYFQGVEQMPRRAAIDVGAKAFYVVLVLTLVRSPEHGWLVLALQAFTNLVSSALLVRSVYRQVKWLRPTISGAMRALRMGASMFLFTSAVSLYTTANTVVLGLFAGPAVVGFYAGPERILKAVQGLLGPVAQAIYPRMSRLRAEDSKRADVMLRLTFVVMLAGGLVLGIATFALAPLAVNLILGPKYAAAVPVLRILAGVIPIVSLSVVFGMQCMLPLGMDRQFNVIIVAAGMLNLGLAAALAPRYGPKGMAMAVLIAESAVTISQYVVLRVNDVCIVKRKDSLPCDVIG